MEKPTLTTAELAEKTGCELVGDPNQIITGVSPLASATVSDASFFSIPAYDQPQRHLEQLNTTQAGAIFISQIPEKPKKEVSYLIADNPSLAFQQAIHHFFKEALELTGFTGVHPTAVVHPTATLAEGVTVSPHAVIDKGSVIGKGTYIGANTFIGPFSKIGNDCQIHPNVTIRERCHLGNRVIIQPGAVIGSCGFGYTQSSEGHHIKLTQAGDVILEDDVEVGANSTIDRARFTTTRIGRGTKIDNLVQLAHGVEIGEDNLIIAQTGVAGGAITGKRVVLAAQSGVNGHIRLDDGVVLAAKAGASKSLKTGRYNGTPAIPLAEYNRNSVYLRNIGKLVKEIKELKKSSSC